MKFFTLVTFFVITSAYEIAQLNVPIYADPRRSAELSCHFAMDEQKLHSLKWYRDANEIFRYNPTQQPPIRVFNISDVAVQGGECFPDYCVVNVMPPSVSTRAAYTCEVSTEGPRFQIARKTKHMTVVGLPEADPVIVGAPKIVKPGEHVFLNCTSDYSLPPSEINWYIDGDIHKEKPEQQTEVADINDLGLIKSWKVLKLEIPSTASVPVQVRCESVMKVDPPVVREARLLITIHAQTQLSKFVSNNSGTNLDYDNVMVIVTNLLVIYYQIFYDITMSL